jgi:aspartate aminotransferase
LFENLTRLNPDSILGLMAKFRADPAQHKVDLGVGVFRDLQGNTPVLECVRRAEREVLSVQNSKTYVAAAGREEFNQAVARLVLGEEHAALKGGRTRTLQAPGGCGALRVGAELIRAAAPNVTVHVSDPTWGNHIPLLGSSGFKLERYPYYDAPSHQLKFEAMLERLERLPAGDVVLLHVCCHNPTGADLSNEQWGQIIDLVARRRLVPFLDLAYLGFGVSLEADAEPVRRMCDKVPEALIAVSFSKNMGLYRERVGALITLSETGTKADAAMSHMLQIARSIYSMPPDHGAAIAARIFEDETLRTQWRGELDAMRGRIIQMRTLLSDELRKASGERNFDFIQKQHGMFSLLGVSPAVVDRLREEHHIYMLQDSRMNLAGIMPHNARYVAEAVVKAMAMERAA